MMFYRGPKYFILLILRTKVLIWAIIITRFCPKVLLIKPVKNLMRINKI